ncbi:hypothetical protein [Nocardia sp. IFM 10818]
MSDVTFPARITVDSAPDLDGMPILSAVITPAAAAAGRDLPAGPAGPPGVVGVPRTTFRKVGEIADQAARPTGLGPEDRGKWWHRLDTGGMDVWTGADWKHSPGAVGAQGLTAPATTVATATTHGEGFTIPTVKVTATGAALEIAATAPAGLQGPPGPTGSSGSISDATDFDDTVAASQRAMFVYNPAGKRWRVGPPPGGFGWWAWYQDDFAATVTSATAPVVAGTFTLPILPFRWRPMVWMSGGIRAVSATTTTPLLTARLNTVTGVKVAEAAGIRASEQLYHVTGFPTFGDEGPKPLSPASEYATIPAGVQASLIVLVEKIGGADTNIVWDRTNASLVLWALPVGG